MNSFPLPEGHSRYVYSRLEEQYDEISKEMSPDEMVLATAYLYGGEKIIVEEFSSNNPLIEIKGFLNGESVIVQVHNNSLQVVFAKVKKTETNAPKKLGFQVNPKESKL